MVMGSDRIASEALRLSPRERALLAGSLWQSLEDPFAAPAEMADVTAVAPALEQDKQIEAGQVEAVPYSEMMARLRRRRHPANGRDWT